MVDVVFHESKWQTEAQELIKTNNKIREKNVSELVARSSVQYNSVFILYSSYIGIRIQMKYFKNQTYCF